MSRNVYESDLTSVELAARVRRLEERVSRLEAMLVRTVPEAADPPPADAAATPGPPTV